MIYQFDPKLAVEYGSNLIKLAYQMYGRATPPHEYTPSYDGLLDDYNFTAWVRMTDFTPKGKLSPKFYGIIVQRKKDPNSFVLAIRGTEPTNWNEWWDNFTSVIPVAFGGFAGKIGDGFGRIFQSMQVLDSDGNPTDEFGMGFVQQVAAAVTRKLVGGRVGGAEQAAAQSLISIEVTGHSLGAALATLYVARNASDRQLHIARLYTFASPYVGDFEFVKSYNTLGIETWRIANFWDRVPHLPPGLEFRHVNQPEHIDSWFEVHADPVCWHSMQTYLHVLDPTISIDEGCEPLPPDPHYIAGH